MVSIGVTVVQEVTRIAFGDLGDVILEGPVAPLQHPVRIYPERRDVVGAERGAIRDTAPRDRVFGRRHCSMETGKARIWY